MAPPFANKSKRLKEPTELERTLRGGKRAFIYAFVFTLAMSFIVVLLPIYSMQVLDRVMNSHSYSTLWVLTGIVTILFIAYGLFSAVRYYALQSVVEYLDATLAPKLMRFSITKASLAGGNSTAAQSQRELATVKGFIAGGLPALMEVPGSLLFLMVIYMVSPLLGFLTLGGIVALIFVAWLNDAVTHKPLDQAQENMIQNFVIADIAGRNAEAVEAMGMGDNVVKNWHQHNQIGQKLANAAGYRANAVQSFTRTMRMLLQIAIIAVGAVLALKNEITVGGLIATSLLTSRALGPFEGAIAIWKSLIAARDSYRRLDEALELGNIQLRGTIELPRPQGRLTVEGVYYQPPGSTPIIKNVSFALEAGESLGLIGPSAAGKSTLAKLIIGLLPPTHGALRLDGMETFKWGREQLGPHVGFMPQQVDLFNGTIKDNIARMDMNAPAEAVIEAAQLAGCHEMILRLPHGYETKYMQGNMSLSPGQRQRIGLARAVYNRPQFIVLDEPNSNLDADGERALINALQRMKEMGMTFIVVAHRPSVVGNVDKLLMLRGGVVERFGPREDILRQYTKPAAAPQPRRVADESNPS